MEERIPLAIPGPNGALHAVLHTAAGSERADKCVVLSSAGLRGRVGPHDLYVHLASALCRPGCDVLRLDCRGVGESHGRLPEGSLVDLEREIVDAGLFVDDVTAAVEHAAALRGHRLIVLGGLCGGAATSVFAATRDHRVRGLLLLGFPILISEDPASGEQTSFPSGRAAYHGADYLRKLWSPRAWLRFLGLRSSYKTLWRTLSAYGRARYGKAGEELHPRANLKAMAALAECAQRSVATLFAFGERDMLLGDFRSEFLGNWAPRHPGLEGTLSVEVIPQADHTFVGRAAEAALSERIRGWLDGLEGPPEGR